MANERLEELTKELLEQLYVKEKLSMAMISKMHKVSMGALKKRLIKFGFTIRNLSQSMKLFSGIKNKPKSLETKQKISEAKTKCNISYEELYQLHWVEEKSLSEIGRLYNFTGATIMNRAKKLGLITRDNKTATKLANTGENNPSKRPEVIEMLSGPNNHFYGKTHTCEIKRILSEKTKNHIKEHGHPQLGTTREGYSGNLNVMHRSDVKEKHKKIMREKFSGENSPGWKGGITPLNIWIRQLPEYHIWRSSCYARDKRVCQNCGDTKEELNVDHIKPMSLILFQNNIKTIKEALDCQELWDTNNGRVLCVRCHKKTPTYGNRNKH